MFIEFNEWDVEEVPLTALGGFAGLSVYEYCAGPRPRLLVIRFKTLPWTLIVTVAPVGTTLCSTNADYRIMGSVLDWGQKAMELGDNYEKFCKEIKTAGFTRETLPMLIFSNVANMGAYKGKSSLRFGKKCQQFNGGSCYGYVVPLAWEQALIDFYKSQLAAFPVRLIWGLTGPYNENRPDYDHMPVDYRLARWALHFCDTQGFDAGVHSYKWADFGSLDAFNQANLAWLDRAIDVAEKDRYCNIPFPHDDFTRLSPRLHNQYYGINKYGLILSSEIEVDLYLRRAKLAVALMCPHHYWHLKKDHDCIKDNSDPNVQVIRGYLETYLGTMENKFPYFIAGDSIPESLRSAV